MPSKPGQPSPVEPTTRDLDVLFTAETHNFPCAVAPFPGAETGAGGRIRDTHATGTGSLIVGATAGYCVGNLQLEGHTAPWEDTEFVYPPNLAPPLQVSVTLSPWLPRSFQGRRVQVKTVFSGPCALTVWSHL